MTEIERSIMENTNLVQVTLVVDVAAPVESVIQQLTAAIAAADHSFFATRFKHECDGGLVTLPERQEYNRLVAEASRGKTLKSLSELAASLF